MNVTLKILVVVVLILFPFLCLYTGNLVPMLFWMALLILIPLLMAVSGSKHLTVTYHARYYNIQKGWFSTAKRYPISGVHKILLRRYTYIERGYEEDDTRRSEYQVYLVNKHRYDKVYVSSSFRAARKEASHLSERYNLPVEGRDIPDLE